MAKSVDDRHLSLIDYLTIAARKAEEAGRVELAKQLRADVDRLENEWCDACKQHKPCSCDDMAADRRSGR